MAGGEVISPGAAMLRQRWNLGLAAIKGLRASRMERASAWRIDGAGHVALEHDPGGLAIKIGDRDG